MMDFLTSFDSVADLIFISCLLALSQYVVLRAGVFSLGTAAFAALGAYTAAVLVTKMGMSPIAGIVAAVAVAMLASAALALPLSRLRGVYQSLGTLALVQIVLTGTLNAVTITNGALGINSIPKVAGTGVLLVATVAVVLFLVALGSCSIGRAFDVIREDETVAVSLGISVQKHHMIAFVVSGMIAGLAGSLQAFNSYVITPNQFGFAMVVNILAMVVLGGRTSVWGALTGAIILSLLPEVFRVFADYRMAVQGVLLMVSIIYLPLGIADTLIAVVRDRRTSKMQMSLQKEASA